MQNERLRELALLGLEFKREQVDQEISWVREELHKLQDAPSANAKLVEGISKMRMVDFGVASAVTEKWDKAFDAQQKSDRSYMRTPAMRRRISLAMKRRWAERRKVK